MIDATRPFAESASMRTASTRGAATAVTGDRAPGGPAEADPATPAGPRPTFAVTTLEQMQAAQKVSAVRHARAIDTAPDATVFPPERRSVNRVL